MVLFRKNLNQTKMAEEFGARNAVFAQKNADKSIEDTSTRVILSLRQAKVGKGE
jgi:hypothetical protein